MTGLVIVGAGGFGRETLDVVSAINAISAFWDVKGYLDDAPAALDARKIEERGFEILGPTSEARRLPVETAFVIAISSPQVRSQVAGRAEFRRLRAATLVHPTANLGAGVVLGDGSVIAGHVDVGCDVTIGRHVHVDRSSQIGHDSELRDFATVHPAAVVSGNCSVGSMAMLGTNCTLIQGRAIGRAARVGAGACVTGDVAEMATVVGVPARAV